MRNVCVIIFIVVLCWGHRLKAEDYVTLVHATTAQVFMNGKVVGSATLPAGQEYQLLGSLNGQSLLQAGTIGYLVDPKATNYDDLYLLKPLGLTHRSAAPTAVASSSNSTTYVPAVSIYPTGGNIAYSSTSGTTSQTTSDRNTYDPSAPIPSSSYFGPYIPGATYDPYSGYYVVYPNYYAGRNGTYYPQAIPTLRPNCGPSGHR